MAIGDSVPDPNIGKRIGPSTGIVINDQEGFERSGYSLLSVGVEYRVVLGLDTKRGTEGLAFLGNAPPNDPSTGVPDSVFGFVLRHGAQVKHILNAASPR